MVTKVLLTESIHLPIFEQIMFNNLLIVAMKNIRKNNSNVRKPLSLLFLLLLRLWLAAYQFLAGTLLLQAKQQPPRILMILYLSFLLMSPTIISILHSHGHFAVTIICHRFITFAISRILSIIQHAHTTIIIH